MMTQHNAQHLSADLSRCIESTEQAVADAQRVKLRLALAGGHWRGASEEVDQSINAMEALTAIAHDLQRTLQEENAQ